MSKFIFSTSALLDYNAFDPAGSRPRLNISLETRAEARDALDNDSLTNGLVFKEYKNRTTDVSVQLSATTGVALEDIAFQTVRFAQVNIVKTATVTTGTVSITIPQFGITSGTLNFGSTNYDDLPIGAVLHSLSGYNAKGVAVGATAVTADFTTPVGFAANILYIGDTAD